MIVEKITYDQPIAENGVFIFLQRCEIESALVDILKEFSGGFRRKLAFFMNLSDTSQQKNLLTIIFIVDNDCLPFVGVFPYDEVRAMNERHFSEDKTTDIIVPNLPPFQMPSFITLSDVSPMDECIDINDPD